MLMWADGESVQTNQKSFFIVLPALFSIKRVGECFSLSLSRPLLATCSLISRQLVWKQKILNAKRTWLCPWYFEFSVWKHFKLKSWKNKPWEIVNWLAYSTHTRSPTHSRLIRSPPPNEKLDSTFCKSIWSKQMALQIIVSSLIDFWSNDN